MCILYIINYEMCQKRPGLKAKVHPFHVSILSNSIEVIKQNKNLIDIGT